MDDNPPKEYFFIKGQYFDSYSFVYSLIESANTEIVLTDPYFDRTALEYLKRSKREVTKTIYVSSYAKINERDIEEYVKEYGDITIKKSDEIHDRILLIDNESCYSLGTSPNSFANKAFIIVKLENKVVVSAIKEMLSDKDINIINTFYK